MIVSLVFNLPGVGKQVFILESSSIDDLPSSAGKEAKLLTRYSLSSSRVEERILSSTILSRLHLDFR